MSKVPVLIKLTRFTWVAWQRIGIHSAKDAGKGTSIKSKPWRHEREELTQRTARNGVWLECITVGGKLQELRWDGQDRKGPICHAKAFSFSSFGHSEKCTMAFYMPSPMPGTGATKSIQHCLSRSWVSRTQPCKGTHYIALVSVMMGQVKIQGWLGEGSG